MMKQCKRVAVLLLALALAVGTLPTAAAARDVLPDRLSALMSTDLDKEGLQPLGSGIIPQAAYTSGTCGENLTWSVDGDTLTISGTGAMDDFSYEHPVPWSESRNVIRYVYIEDGVTSIGDEAFSNCSKLLDCHIGRGVAHVGRYAFYAAHHARLYFWGNAPEFHEEAFTNFDGWAYHFSDWDMSVIQDYGGEPTWDRGEIVLSPDNKQLYQLNEPIDAGSLIFYAYVFSNYRFDYTPMELVIGEYDNSTYGQKSVVLTVDGQEMIYSYHVTDGGNHLDTITVEYDQIYEYRGNRIYPDPIVRAGDMVLENGVHYSIEHNNSLELGIGNSFTITGKGIYEGFTRTCSYAIVKRDISGEEFNFYARDTEFYGIPTAAEVVGSIWYDGTGWTLEEGRDYLVIYEDNVNIGTGTARIVGTGGFCGAAVQTFQINKKDTSLWLDGAYNGNAADGELNDDYYYQEGLLSPGVLTARINTHLSYVAYYSLYHIVGEEMELVTEFESEYGTGNFKEFTYDFTDVYNSDNPDGGETYLLFYTWMDSDYSVYSGACLMFVSAEVPEATTMAMGAVLEDGDFRREYLTVAGEDGVLKDVTWTSSDDSVLTVDKGAVTLVKPGTAVVTAQAGGLSVSYELTVPSLDLSEAIIFNYDAEEEIANVIYEDQLLEPGKDYTFTVTSTDGVTEVRAEGIGLFEGVLIQQFDAVTGEAGHFHTFDNACDSTCNGCDYTRETSHQYAESWTKDMNGHWHECTVCGDKADYAEHALNADGECTVCGPLFVPGDLNGTMSVDEDDAIYLLQYVLLPDFFPVDQEVDYNHDNQVNEDDAIYLLQHVLLPDFFPL